MSKVYIIKLILAVYLLMCSTLFDVLLLKKLKSNFSLASMKLLTNFFKILTVTLFRQPKAAIFTLKMHKGSRL